MIIAGINFIVCGFGAKKQKPSFYRQSQVYYQIACHALGNGLITCSFELQLIQVLSVGSKSLHFALI